MPVESDADILGMFDAQDFGVAAKWGPGWGRDWPRTLVVDLVTAEATLSAETTDLAVILDDPTDRAASFAVGAGSLAQRDSIMLPAAAIPAEPLRDDVMTVVGAAFTIAQAQSDIDRALWRVTLAKA